MTEENRSEAPDQGSSATAPGDDADRRQPEPENADEGDAPKPRPDAPEDDDVDEKDLGQSATVINNFYANVDASAAIFGIGTRPAARSVTGILRADAVAAAVARFVAPPRFEELVARLRERRVLVLAGPADSGKWTGAVGLLTRMPLAERDFIMLSPARDLEHLVTRTRFKPGRGHLIQDWAAAEGASAVQRFQFETLHDKLAAADAYLVITLTGKPAEADVDHHVAWEPPAAADVFNAHLDVPITPEIEQVREQVGELRSARRIAELARRISEGRGSPLELLADVSGDDVRAWFDGRPGRSEVLVIAALAFAYRIPERLFERLVVELTAIADEVQWQGREPERRADDDDLPQARAMWTGSHPLITVEHDGPAGHGERHIVFRGSHHREQVIKELVDRYDYRLWEPLRRWIRQLPIEYPDLQLQVVAGLAVLARANLGEVHESFLDVWAGGSWRERLAAANLLSLMCADDELVAAARETAVSWVYNAGPQRAMTAALAFAGGLAIRDPAGSVAWLWFLALRQMRVSAAAQRALTLLFQSAAERPGDILPPLQLLAAHVDHDMREGLEPSLTRRALSAVLAVLGSDRLEAEGEPVAAWVLRSEPESARHLGVLWAWTLRSAYHRADAIRALCHTLEDLDGRDGALEAAQALGAAVWSALPGEFAVLVRQAIRQAIVSRQNQTAAPQITRELVLALLHPGTGQD